MDQGERRSHRPIIEDLTSATARRCVLAAESRLRRGGHEQFADDFRSACLLDKDDPRRREALDRLAARAYEDWRVWASKPPPSAWQRFRGGVSGAVQELRFFGRLVRELFCFRRRRR
jgi:hypothetical protein